MKQVVLFMIGVFKKSNDKNIITICFIVILSELNSLVDK